MAKKKTRSKDMDKFIHRMEMSQKRIKEYLLFNGTLTKPLWIPPLNKSEELSNTAAKTRMCRLIELLVTEVLPYRIDRATEEDPNNEDIVYKKIDRYDRYIINGTTLALTYNPETGKFGCASLPIMVPFINTEKPMSMKKFFNHADATWAVNNGVYTKICTPLITVSYPDGTGHIIRVNKDIHLSMQCAYDTVIHRDKPLTDEDIGAVLGMIRGESLSGQELLDAKMEPVEF